METLEFRRGRKKGSKDRKRRIRRGLFIGGGLAAGVAGIGTAAYYYRNQRNRKPKPIDIEPIDINNKGEFKVKPWSESPQAKADGSEFSKQITKSLI